MKDSLKKSPTKQSKNKQIARDRDREAELTHVSLKKKSRLTFLPIGNFITHPMLASSFL